LLKADIQRRGVLVPIELDEHGMVLDGHHRLAAYRELKTEGHSLPDYPVIVRTGLSEAAKRAHVRMLNIARRSLTATQRRKLVAQQLQDTPTRSDRAVAHDFRVSPTTVAMVRRRLRARDGTVQNGQLPDTDAPRVGRDGRVRHMPTVRMIVASSERRARRALADLALIPPEALPLRLLSSDELTTAARLVGREESRRNKLDALQSPPPLTVLQGAPFRLILMDPPWTYEGASSPDRTADRHYPTMTHEELAALPIPRVAARQAVLFLWATPPKVAEAIDLVARWGFEYRTCAVWDKQIAGLGSWFRQQHELLLVATRGHIVAPSPATRPPSVIRAKRGRHSEKPGSVRKLLAQMYPGVRRLELFARSKAPGWTAWGNEIPEEQTSASSSARGESSPTRPDPRTRDPAPTSVGPAAHSSTS
jgi:N6-adenosine-specific RNA methylase IME4